MYKLFYPNAMPQAVQIKVHLIPPNENVVVYDVEYKINRHKRREVENQQAKTKASRFVVSLGDSFTFGEGVTTGEDYPSQLAKKLSPDFMVYNFGKPGFGPNDLLFRLQTSTESFSDIPQNEGVAIWFYIPAQLDRTACGFLCLLRNKVAFISDKPNYELAGTKPVYFGKFADANSLSTKMAEFFVKSEAIKFGINYVSTDHDEIDYRTFVALLKEIKTILEQSKNLQKFYVLNLEGNEHDVKLLGLLREAGIEVLDYSSVPKFNYVHAKIPYDWHPTASYYWFLTEMLKTAIEPGHH